MKINKLLPVSLLLVMGMVDAKHQCFRPYNINVVNKSGGVAKLLHAKDIAGMTKGSTINNNRSKRLQVSDMGAHASFEVGPEEQKQKVSVSLYDTTGANPHVILEPRAVKAFDVNTAQGKTFDVMIKNESGGVATVTGCGAKDLKVANGASARIRVHAGASAHIVAGREGRKNMYVINFFEKNGENPSVFLGGGEFFSSGVRAKGVNIKVSNGSMGRLAMGMTPRYYQAKSKMSNSGQMRKKSVAKQSPMRPKNKAQ